MKCFFHTGYEKDGESGLEYAQARYYNSSHGRFTSVDPLTASASIRNPQTFNRYSYALNSPYKFTDPLGLAVGVNGNPPAQPRSDTVCNAEFSSCSSAVTGTPEEAHINRGQEIHSMRLMLMPPLRTATRQEQRRSARRMQP